jgi:hypothetical protein
VALDPHLFVQRHSAFDLQTPVGPRKLVDRIIRRGGDSRRHGLSQCNAQSITADSRRDEHSPRLHIAIRRSPLRQFERFANHVARYQSTW